MSEHTKIPLPKYLKLFTTQNVPIHKAIAYSGKIYKEYNTAAKLAQLDEVKLLVAGIDIKEDRKVIMDAMKKSGYVSTDSRKRKLEHTHSDSPIRHNGLNAVQAVKGLQTTPVQGKGKRPDNSNDLLPTAPMDDEAINYGNLEFNEILDEDILKTKSAVVNRAPLMTAWATVVAERIGFRREEALSIATVYTEMNAVAKGSSIGIYKDGEQRSIEAVKGGSQPYIELMGRRPLYRTQTEQWRALSNGSPVKPSTAFSYISRAFRQTTSYITGALRLLADSFTVQEINQIAWSLYADFRPAVDQWGKRSEVKCSTILNLRKRDKESSQHITSAEGAVEFGSVVQKASVSEDNVSPNRKRMKLSSLEEYEATLDDHFNYSDVDLSIDKF